MIRSQPSDLGAPGAIDPSWENFRGFGDRKICGEKSFDFMNHEVPKYLGDGTQFLEEGHIVCIGERASSLLGP
jgi:hypothetical protein